MRITFGALTAAITVLAVAVPGVAQAAPAKPAGKPGKTITVRGKRPKATAVKAGATGTGPANQKECNAHAVNISADLKNAKAEQAKGNAAEAGIYADSARANIDLAMDRGCFVIF